MLVAFPHDHTVMNLYCSYVSDQYLQGVSFISLLAIIEEMLCYSNYITLFSFS